MADAGVELTSLRSPSVRERVLAQLRRLIEDGTFPPGSRLPGERELSDQMQVSRGTVREAVQLLSALGVVKIRHGHGTFVRRRPGAEDVRQEWIDWTVRHSGHVRELLEIRRGLESFAAELAAHRREDRDLAAMEETLDATAAAAEPVDVPALVQSDVGFHHALSEATGNRALAELLDAIGQRLTRERATAWDFAGRPQRSLEQHRAILDAIAAGTPAQARDAVIAHLRSVESDLAQLGDPTSTDVPHPSREEG